MKVHVALALWLASGILPAAADSRDLVLERISRCYALTDTRQYLECLYGAAQPLRGELGLQPAPQATSYAALFARPAGQPAYAPPAAAAPAAPAPTQPSASRQPQNGIASDMLSTVMGIKTMRVPPEQFGLPRARPGRGVNVDHITARMAQYSLGRPGGYFTVTLDNGQVWRQREGDEHNPIWNKPASSYVVTVSYGAGGTYNLVVAGEREPYKVTRIR
jgi:hypothetical protein